MTTKKPHETGCLVCGAAKIYGRGLCQPDYRHFMKRQKMIEVALGKAAADKFESELLAAGLIKAKSKGGRNREKNPVDLIADRVVAEFRSQYTTAANAGGCDHVIKKVVPKCKLNGGDKPIRKKRTP